MNLSTRAKILTGVGLVVAAFVWLVLLDYGINAGRIHYGVHVNGVDVGGMTLEEAQGVLRREADRLREAPVAMSAQGMNCSFLPEKLGWKPRAKTTAQSARDVGFTGGFRTVLRDRLRAWFAGVEVDWAARFKAPRVDRLVDDCERQAEGLQLSLDRARLERLIDEAVTTWPRRVYEVPVEASG